MQVWAGIHGSSPCYQLEALLQRFLLWNQCTWHLYYGVNLFSSLGDAVRHIMMLQDPKQVPSQSVWGVLCVCLRVLQGAKEKLCISRQALIFHIQSSASSVSTTAASPDQQFWCTLAFVSPLRFSVRKHLNQDKVWKCTCVLLPDGNCILVECHVLCITLSKDAL